MKTYNKFLETPFSEEANSLTPPEPPQEEDPQIKSKEKRQKQIKKMVLLKKLQAVRAGAGADIVAGYEPEGEQLDETPKGDVGKDPETVQRRRNEDQNRRRGDRGSRLPDKAQELRRREHKMRRGAKTGPLRSGKQPDKVSQDVSRLRRITDTFSSQAHRKEEVEMVEASAVLDANTKISSTEKREKLKKELDTLTKRAKAMKKHGSGYHPMLHGEAKIDEVELDERLGGKGYKPYTSLTGKKVSGDWEDSDRGKGNKAKKRAGGKVEKKSPTYLAHVLNKKKKVSEGTDKAFDFVKAKIEKEVGKSGYVSKDNPRKPQTDAEKAKARAHQAKVDKENAAARAKDPSQGRYPKG